MKDFIMKHPIITFLLADAFMTGLFNTIRAFAPNGEKAEAEDGEKSVSDPEDEDKSVSDPEEDLVQHISKEETV